MNNLTVYEQQILNGIKDFSPELLAEVVDFVEFIRHRRVTDPSPSLDQAPPVVGTAWQNLAGAISAEDLALMQQTIEEGCERVDLNEW